LFGQENLTSDELFAKARKAAFDEKDYPTAIKIAQQALEKSPDYTDISIFLGRVYTWSNDLTSARQVFDKLDQRNVKDEDFYIAYASLEYWNNQYDKAISILDKGLSYHPQSEELWLLKAKVYNSNNQYIEAEKATSSVLGINPKNTEARALANRIKELTSKNALGITYNYSHFDKQFDNDWHIIGVSYKRATSIGSFIIRGNYANKFAQNGTQIELEAYPRISKTFYLYAGAGYSNDVGIFPNTVQVFHCMLIFHIVLKESWDTDNCISAVISGCIPLQSENITKTSGLIFVLIFLRIIKISHNLIQERCVIIRKEPMIILASR
jgi:tetratricopeptide (TPR) repeat protein